MDALSSRRDGLTRTRQLMQVENLGAPASPATLASSARGGGASASLVRAAKEGVKPASPLSSVPSPRAETDKVQPRRARSRCFSVDGNDTAPPHRQSLASGTGDGTRLLTGFMQDHVAHKHVIGSWPVRNRQPASPRTTLSILHVSTAL